MTRLENYLEKNCVSVSCAKGTQSKYYRIGAAIIRYSDHVSVDYSGFDIQIIKPVGSFSCLYMFGVSSSSRFSLMNAKQIIAYLPFASMEAELKGAVNYQKPEEVINIKTNTMSLTDLNNIAIALDKKLSESPRKSFISDIAPDTEEDELRFNIVKDVINTKLVERSNAQNAKAKAAEKAQLLEIIHRKKNQAMENMSVEELEAKLASLEN